ncbi:kinase [Striga asiatica]|uniref:Kinase n=1 Tax=Striga asiatica TaxID=4170 RepID=A0A5A7QRQ7_STRAF|nr:kinase [Striga asiatica]
MKFNFLHNYSLFSVAIIIIIVPFPAASAGARCNHTCAGRTVPFPFGFSAACPIRLDCAPGGAVLAAGLPVQSIDGDTLSLGLRAACRRPVEALRRLFTENFAPTATNAMLLRECRNRTTGADCFMPRTAVQTHFELADCDGPAVACYAEAPNRTAFMDYRRMTRSGCRWLFSAISMNALANDSSVSLDVEVVRVGWWLRGGCRCSEHGRCVHVSPPEEGNGAAYRCECLEGFTGDGFRDGLGCRQASLACDPPKYLSGQCGGTKRVGILIGAAAVGAFFMVMLGLIVCLVRNKSKLTATRSRRVPRRRDPHETSGITIPIYPYTEIEKATDFFSEKRRLGCGAYGTVYSGRINDEWVAVKRIQRRYPSCTEQVLNEIRLISSVSHPNLVRLLGCSLDRDDEHALVYEFMPNGTLAEHLLARLGRAPLPWPVRLTIAAETASAVAHLHGAGPRPIYHRDIKSSNILLDARFGSKVADFGLSRPGPGGELSSATSHVSTAPQGTPGYVDPQYHTSFRMSDRSDVYSFGVVLAEIITGMQAVDLERPMEEANLATLAADRIGKGRLDEILDPALKEEMATAEADSVAWTRESVGRVAELAFRCLAWNGEARPPMGEVAKELEGIRVSRWIASHVGPTTTMAARLSLSSDTSERPLNSTAGDEDGGGGAFFGSENSGDDTWRSEGSSSSSLLNRQAVEKINDRSI